MAISTVDEQTNQSIVIDNGSCQLKSGLSGFHTPEVFMNISNEHLIKRGVITNFDVMQEKWDKILHHDKFTTNNTTISSALFMEVPLNTRHNREKTTEIAFESLDLSQFYLLNTAIGACYATGRTQGIVMDSGYEQTMFNIIFDGYLMPHLFKSMSIGGAQITETLAKSLAINTKLGLNDINNIKENCSFVCYDYESESKKYANIPIIFKHSMH
eukprot:369309_1